jgi:hypothetical protein
MLKQPEKLQAKLFMLPLPADPISANLNAIKSQSWISTACHSP